MTASTRTITLTRPDQLKALADSTRSQILRILDTGPASAKALAGGMEMTHGKVGHHLRVLERAGLVEVVETRAVRAVVEKFYGPTFDILRFGPEALPNDRLRFLLDQAAIEASPNQSPPFEDPGRFLTVRMSQDQATAFLARTRELADEFAASASEEGPTFGFVAAVFTTDTPTTP